MSVDANGVKRKCWRARRSLCARLGSQGNQRRTTDPSAPRNVSTRRLPCCSEDMEALGPVKIKDVQAAQQEMIVRAAPEVGE